MGEGGIHGVGYGEGAGIGPSASLEFAPRYDVRGCGLGGEELDQEAGAHGD
jgi:hypothetical protein